MIHYDGPALLSVADEVDAAYADVFSAQPWNEPAETLAKFRGRLESDVRREGFRAVVARSADGVEGFATGWLTPAEFPRDRVYGRVYDELGADRVSELLVGALEVDELAVRPRSQGAGLGRKLLAELVDDTAAWLLTDRDACD